MCDSLDISLPSISISLPSILFGTRHPCVPGKMAVFYHTEQVLNDLSPHTMSLKLQINLFPRIIIDNLPLVFASCLLTYFWIGNETETVLLALRLQMNSFPSLPESWPLVTLSENDPNWILPWARLREGNERWENAKWSIRKRDNPLNNLPSVSCPAPGSLLWIYFRTLGKKARRWPTVLWVWDMILSLLKKT